MTSIGRVVPPAVGLEMDCRNSYPIVTGAPYSKGSSRVATAPKLEVQDKDRVNNSRRITKVKPNIIKLEALRNYCSRKSWLSK